MQVRRADSVAHPCLRRAVLQLICTVTLSASGAVAGVLQTQVEIDEARAFHSGAASGISQRRPFILKSTSAEVGDDYDQVVSHSSHGIAGWKRQSSSGRPVRIVRRAAGFASR